MNEVYRYRKLLHFGTLLLRESKPGDLQKTLFELLPEVIDIDGAALFIRSEKDRWLMKAASAKGILLKSIRPRLRAFVEEQEGKGLSPQDLGCPLIIQGKAKRSTKSFATVAAFPLGIMGRISAFIAVARKADQAFSTDDLNRLDNVAAILSTTMESQFGLRQLKRRATDLEAERKNLRSKMDERTRELCREREFASFLSERAPYLVFVLDRRGIITLANTVCRQATGYPSEELVGKPFMDLIYPGECPEKQEWASALFKSRDSQSFQTTLVTREGKHRMITWNTVKRTNTRGRPQEVICIGKDVTRSAHLETHNRVLMETLPDGLFRVNDRFEVVEVNKYAADLMGIEVDSILGRKCYETICSETRETCPIFTEGCDTITHETTLPVSDPEGGDFHVLKSIRRYRLGPNEYALETFKDISKLKRMDKAIRDYTENLEKMVEERTEALKEVQRHLIQSEKLAATGRLAASIAHEINNPIYGIRGCLESILEEVPLKNEMKAYVKLSIKETNRISDLIRRMQDFHRESKGRRQPVDINGILKDVLVLSRSFIQKNHITLHTDFAPRLPKVMACEDEIKQVFINLISNAVESMTKGGSLTITSANRGATVEVAFADTGCGMSREVKDRIFDAFFTTKSAVKGVGLGLPVCWGIIRSHGGQVVVESEPRRGSIFVVALPAESAASAKEL